jgi:hypothetical protein
LWIYFVVNNRLATLFKCQVVTTKAIFINIGQSVRSIANRWGSLGDQKENSQ